MNVCAIFILEQIYLITKNKERLLVMKRENFGSRLGFILVSAGCAIGLGNVWKFPYMAGQYGGAAFILIYLLFLVILGLPIIVCEFSVGRASQKSIATSYNVLEPKGTRWHFTRWFAIAGNYLLLPSGSSNKASIRRPWNKT